MTANRNGVHGDQAEDLGKNNRIHAAQRQSIEIGCIGEEVVSESIALEGELSHAIFVVHQAREDPEQGTPRSGCSGPLLPG